MTVLDSDCGPVPDRHAKIAPTTIFLGSIIGCLDPDGLLETYVTAVI